MGLNAIVKHKLNGVSCPPPKEWPDLQILATFDNAAVQANIETDYLTFVNENARDILAWIGGGLNGSSPGIFEGIPFTEDVYNENSTYSAFTGCLDLTKIQIISPVEVRCPLRKNGGLNELEERLQGITLGLLEAQGYLTSSSYTNCKYVVQREVEALELVMLNISIFLLGKELYDAIYRLTTFITNGPGHALGGGPFGPIGAAIFFAVEIIVQLLYIVAIVIALKSLIKEMFALLIPGVKEHKTLKLRKGLEAICSKLGLTLVAPDTMFDDIYYLPSKPGADTPITSGVPNPSDFGYGANEFIELCIKLINGKVAVRDNELHLRWVGDAFWFNTSTYQMPSVLRESYTYNTDEHRSNTLISFATDEADKYTLENFTGTNYEVVSSPLTVQNPKNNLSKGLLEVQIPCALGTRKDKLTDVENTLKNIGKIVDKLINFFGGNSDFAGKIEARVGLLKVSQNIHYVPKLLKLTSSGRLPSNYRTAFKAKTLWDNYWYFESFALNGALRQRKFYEIDNVPFGFQDYLAIINNGYFTTSTGEIAGAQEIRWNRSQDKAYFKFWVAGKYTNNIFETYIEP